MAEFAFGHDLHNRWRDQFSDSPRAIVPRVEVVRCRHGLAQSLKAPFLDVIGKVGDNPKLQQDDKRQDRRYREDSYLSE